MAKYVPRQRKHRVRQRQHIQETNAIETIPQNAQDAAIRSTLQESLRAEKPASSRKKKRMEKYIDRKIRKDNSAELIRKLEQAHAATVLRQSLDQRKVGRQAQSAMRLAKSDLMDSSEGTSSDSDDDSREEKGAENRSQNLLNPGLAQPSFGSGLKRPLDSGSSSLPKRKRLNQAKSTFNSNNELPWEGFSSNDEKQKASATLSEIDKEGSISALSSADSLDDNDDSQVSDQSDSVFDEDRIDASRTSAFKAWAMARINEAVGFTPSAKDHTIALDSNQSLKTVSRIPDKDPLPPELQISYANQDRKAYSVLLKRRPDIQEARLKLPVVGEEQRIMEAIHGNPVVVICGATGSGKTTQVPQFLYEAGFGNLDGPTPGIIGITQPRRVAAVSMAQRVNEELNVSTSKVAYQIRYDVTVTKDTAIKFMTDGILLREMANDFLLTKYSVVVVDEAHERTVNTDVLIGMLTRCVKLRNEMAEEDGLNKKPLKLIIMSATLRIDDFMKNSKLFKDGKPPLLDVEGRQFNVEVHFTRRTRADFVDEMFQKVCKGHKKLPPGGMLCFLTGQIEINALAKKLKEAFPATNAIRTHQVRISANETPLEIDDFDFSYDDNGRSCESDSPSDSEDEMDFVIEGETTANHSTIHVLPLYSMIPTKEQLKVFDKPPEGSRLIVLATNIAETSITIPGIRYVFDSGRVKEKKYNHVTGVQSFEIGWISKANAEQRKGRAGRLGPGHCYRLYSSAVFERDFEQHAEPEILRVPIEGVVLQLKRMHIPNVINFPFPTPPDRDSLSKAERILRFLGAVSLRGEITDLGHKMSNFPLSPRYARMLANVDDDGSMIPHIVTVIASLAVPELIPPETQFEQESSEFERVDDDSRLRQYRQYLHHCSRLSSVSDAMKLMTALIDYERVGDQEQSFLNVKAVREAQQLKQQLLFYARATSQINGICSNISEPMKMEVRLLQRIVAAAFLDQIAIRADRHPHPPEIYRNPSRAIDVPYLPLIPIAERPTSLLDKAVLVHPTSVLAHLSATNLPEYVVYSHLQRGTNSKTRMHALTAVTEAEILRIARGTSLLEYSKPLKILVDKIGERCSIVIPALVGAKGSTPWPLPAQKVLQKKIGTDWVVDKVWEDGRWQ